MAGPHGPEQSRGAERLRQIGQEAAEQNKRLERLVRAGWSFRYDGAKEEFVMTRTEVRGHTIDAVLDKAEASG